MRLPKLSLLSLITLLLNDATAKPTKLTLYLPTLPNANALPSRTHATLSSQGTHLSAPLTTSNAFVFQGLPPGSYLVEIHCPSLAFRPLRVDVGRRDGEGGREREEEEEEGRELAAAWETFRGNDWANKGEALAVVRGVFGAGFELRPLGAKAYFVERPGFSVLGILKSPMILMGLASMLMVFGMPYLMDNMDPEMKAEFDAQQRKGGPVASIMGGAGPASGNPLGDFDMAAFLAGSKKKDAPPPPADGDAAPRQQGVRR
ncbi:hypothetical protein L249_3275 [Ophiocordyceps polyrhachis-furcata BCC 54312]|uniref:ER membrane protein complex subunit 7 beta-sandwich domain-containing protein n=1 Tax=Ophiocordyceps polyrhachis-furcata BCC 54312 TaxID=1330021 RepID=A0A367LPX9_9HYPO|nr:hypothetical protein L249_3275 [Ophiocordyceps polyrhachis-furcata BCC 54312]